jgi:hypothetical protein
MPDVPADQFPVHIDLDLRLSGEELRGRAAAAGGGSRDFEGWLGLMAALSALIEPEGGG